MTYHIASDCHLTIQHDSLNGGEAYGFILAIDSHDPGAGPAVSIQKEVDSDGNVNDRIFFTVLLGDYLINPDGTKHTDTRSAMYSMLLQFLQETEDLTLTCSAGVLSNLCALGHVSTELHYGDHSVVTCQLTNYSTYYPPADPATFNSSVWDGVLTWNTSYWRNTAITPPPMVP